MWKEEDKFDLNSMTLGQGSQREKQLKITSWVEKIIEDKDQQQSLKQIVSRIQSTRRVSVTQQTSRHEWRLQQMEF